MPKPIRLTICEPDVDGDLIKHEFEITVDADGVAEIRNVHREGIAQRGRVSHLTVGNQPVFTTLELRVEAP